MPSLADELSKGGGRLGNAGQGSARRNQAPAPTRRFIEAKVEDISPNPHQPRKTFNQDTLALLAESIRQNGLLQPLVVQPDPDRPGKLRLIAGERRLRACMLEWCGLEKVPCHLMEDGDPAELAIVENALREDLAPLEEAEALARLRDQGYTLERLAELTGKGKSTLSEIMSLAALPPSVKERVETFKREIPRRTLVEVAKIAKEKGFAEAVEALESAKGGIKRDALRAKRRGQGKPAAQKETPSPLTPSREAARAAGVALSLAGALSKLDLDKVEPNQLAALGGGLKTLAREADKAFHYLKKTRLEAKA